MKLCKDCIHFLPEHDARFGLCGNAPKDDLVWGRPGYFQASVERGSSLPIDCGPEGRHWVAKEPEAA